LLIYSRENFVIYKSSDIYLEMEEAVPRFSS